MHAGFKAARDEVLRYAAQYMKSHRITGNLKVWIAGHSRGAAISNSLGGFFAGGGDEYFSAVGVPVSVTPENVYCYTFSTPRPIRPGLTHAEDLSVAGNRANYPNDTPGQAYVSRNTGAVDPGAACYNGIRNYPKYHDVVPKLPPSIQGWDFTYYGQVCQYDSSDLPGGPVTEGEMVQQLKAFDWQMYKTFTNGGSPEDYQRVTLDFDKLIEKVCTGDPIVIADVMKPTDKGPGSMGDLMQSRVNSLGLIASSPGVFYDNEFQHAAQALAGLFGMVSLDLNDPNVNTGDLIKAAVFWILDFSVTRLKDSEGFALSCENCGDRREVYFPAVGKHKGNGKNPGSDCTGPAGSRFRCGSTGYILLSRQIHFGGSGHVYQGRADRGIPESLRLGTRGRYRCEGGRRNRGRRGQSALRSGRPGRHFRYC